MYFAPCRQAVRVVGRLSQVRTGRHVDRVHVTPNRSPMLRLFLSHLNELRVLDERC